MSGFLLLFVLVTALWLTFINCILAMENFNSFASVLQIFFCHFFDHWDLLVVSVNEATYWRQKKAIQQFTSKWENYRKEKARKKPFIALRKFPSSTSAAVATTTTNPQRKMCNVWSGAFLCRISHFFKHLKIIIASLLYA